jgi:AcrR family transcriptional regulator
MRRVASPRRITREERKAETRERLLVAAARVFAERGFQAASVDEVAQAAGFTKGAVYAHFESKEELFLAMLDARFAEQLEQARSVFANHADPRAQAEEAGTRFIAQLDRDPQWCLLFFEFWAHAVRNPEVGRRLVESYRRLREGIADIVRARAGEEGAELAVAPERFALMAFAMANGVAFERVLEPDAVPEDLYGTMLGALLTGLKEPAATA